MGSITAPVCLFLGLSQDPWIQDMGACEGVQGEWYSERAEDTVGELRGARGLLSRCIVGMLLAASSKKQLDVVWVTGRLSLPGKDSGSTWSRAGPGLKDVSKDRACCRVCPSRTKG